MNRTNIHAERTERERWDTAYWRIRRALREWDNEERRTGMAVPIRDERADVDAICATAYPPATCARDLTADQLLTEAKIWEAMLAEKREARLAREREARLQPATVVRYDFSDDDYALTDDDRIWGL